MSEQQAIPLYEIPVPSIESWAAEYTNVEKWGEELDRMPDNLLYQHAEVFAGRAVLKTLDGAIWQAMVTGDVRNPRVHGATAATLLDYLVDHKCLADHQGPRLPLILFNRQTLDTTHVFCQDCSKFVDLSQDARVFDELGNRVPDDEENGEDEQEDRP